MSGGRMDIDERFEQFDDDAMKFGGVANKLSQRPDLHVFLFLDAKFPRPGRDMVSAAEHDTIYLSVNGEQADSLTDDEIHDMRRCGVMYSDEHDCLFMFA